MSRTKQCFWLIVLTWTAVVRGGEEARTLDGAGGWASNTTFQTIVSACLFTPAGPTANAQYLNHSGFLHSFLLHTNRDTDADGIVNEDDPDDDNDGLDDDVELAGSAFDPAFETNPLDPDGDNDHMSDGAEAEAGTNPDDASSLLRITGIGPAAGLARIVWMSRGGRTYELRGTNNVAALDADLPLLDTVTATGGAWPWYETMSTGHVALGVAGFLKIELKGVNE